jgi:hypothetical protein
VEGCLLPNYQEYNQENQEKVLITINMNIVKTCEKDTRGIYQKKISRNKDEEEFFNVIK